jgi:TPR repeat protein
MPTKIISCVSLPPATTTSVPIHDCAEANEEMANMSMETYLSCCGKSICSGCIHSFKSLNIGTCPFCNSDHVNKTDDERVQELMKRVEANDAGAMTVLGSNYYHGHLGLQHDWARAMELWKQAGILGSSKAHFQLGAYYHAGGDSKKEKFHYEAAAMAGHEVARYNLGTIEVQSGNVGRAVKHWTIAASAGEPHAMKNILINFKQGHGVNRDALNSTLTAYNNYCAEMRSEARDAYIHFLIDHPFQ